MFDFAERLIALRDVKKAIESRLKEINNEIELAKTNLISEMVSQEMQSFNKSGNQFVLVTKKSYSAAPENKQALYEALKEQGYEHLFSVNSMTLNAFVKEMAENNEQSLPDWIDGLVSIYESQDVQIRKK